MQVKALKNIVDVCIYFNETRIGKETEEALERKGRTVRQATRRTWSSEVRCAGACGLCTRVFK